MSQNSLPQKSFKKVMHGLDMTLFTVCAVLVVDTLTASAAIGPSSISWWIITLVLFFVPYGMITAELEPPTLKKAVSMFGLKTPSVNAGPLVPPGFIGSM